MRRRFKTHASPLSRTRCEKANRVLSIDLSATAEQRNKAEAKRQGLAALGKIHDYIPTLVRNKQGKQVIEYRHNKACERCRQERMRAAARKAWIAA